jgi:hypothetical protein
MEWNKKESCSITNTHHHQQDFGVEGIDKNRKINISSE